MNRRDALKLAAAGGGAFLADRADRGGLLAAAAPVKRIPRGPKTTIKASETEKLNEALKLSPRDPFKYLWFVYFGIAAFAAERYDEAAAWAREAIQETPQFPTSLRLLAASYGQLGRIDEAQAALADLRRLMPGVTIETTRAQVPWKRAADMERYLDGLRKAGMEDSEELAA